MWLLSDLACNSDHFALVLSIDLEQTRDLVWPAMDFAFSQFGKNLILHMGNSFVIGGVVESKLTSKYTKLLYAMCLGTIGIKLI